MKTKPLALLTLTLLPTLFTPAFAADLPLDTPTEDFTINNDGTVLHKKTGLSWQRCSVGQTWNATTSNCDGTAQTMTWDDAMKNYNTDCNGWRLPRKDELDTIVEHGKFSPAINSTIFPSTPTNNSFWSASVHADSPSLALDVNFYYGYGGSGSKDGGGAIRLVRGGQACSFDPLNTPTTDFTDNKDGTVTHKKTGLMWQRCSIGQTWDGTTCSGSASSMTWDDATKQISTLASQSDWRLPTENELKTIVEYNAYKPAINSSIFPNTPTNVWFWSASVNAANPGYAWVVNFNYGGRGDDYLKNGGSAVRLVRGKWQAPLETEETGAVDLSVAITKPAAVVTTNKKATYKITVTNNSEFTATGVKAYFVIPGKTLVTVDVPKNCTANGRIIECTLADLAAKKNATQSFSMTVWKKGALNVAATTTSVEDDVNLDNNEASAVISVK
jgi:uncharacterized repeat protein (TIGR01451 family)